LEIVINHELYYGKGKGSEQKKKKFKNPTLDYQISSYINKGDFVRKNYFSAIKMQGGGEPMPNKD